MEKFHVVCKKAKLIPVFVLTLVLAFAALPVQVLAEDEEILHKFKEVPDNSSATCTTPGYAMFSCADDCPACAQVPNPTPMFKVSEVPATGHDMRLDPDQSTPATCTAEGKNVEVCNNCGETEVEVLPVIDHNYVKSESDSKAATCTENGVEVLLCTICNDKVEKVIKAQGHNKTDKITKAPTCTETGLKNVVCATCGEELEKDVVVPADKSKHAFGEWKVTKEATEAAEGTEERVCGLCGEVESRTIPKTAKGTATATPKNNAKPGTSTAAKTTTAKSGNPKTGDSAAAAGFMLVVLLSGTVLAVNKKRRFQ